MPYHWQSDNMKQSGVDDMVLLQRMSESSIVDNLRKRYMEDSIYTYIGPVLIAINPFKELQIYSDKFVDLYQGAAAYENRPHIYALTDHMFRDMLIDSENQCVIISGESGAGKTVSARLIMSYVAKVSGGGGRVKHIKDVILQSNPLLEAFGNAKTVRNNNSSRFGKYVEIQFSRGGEPTGGRISNFLLEKPRVVSQNEDERNFHIFYQIIAGASPKMKENFGICDASYFNYLNQSRIYSVSGVDDKKDFNEIMSAMEIIGLDDASREEIVAVTMAILHLGNISFKEVNNYAVVLDDQALDFPAYLLGVDRDILRTKLLSRQLESKWGNNTENVQVTLNVEQSCYTRDALAKVIFSRLFDWLVATVNGAMKHDQDDLIVGILDIYGFEIFQRNGFEQFCINFVNEKLQQIFVELTLKTEQEEYMSEGIKWVPVKYFNNKTVVDLIEARQPVAGIMCVLDDVCAKLHAVTDTADAAFLQQMLTSIRHDHLESKPPGFAIHHYAGIVQYDPAGFCERNRDVLFPDLIQLMQSSTDPFIVALFPENVSDPSKRKRPTTTANRIRTQACQLVDKLMLCSPHYIRCIKPNETKKARDWEESRVLHQVEYLGLKENIRVRRAGFAYRRPFEKFLHRYAILTKETWPRWQGDPRKGIRHLMQFANLDDDQWQLGKTKLFIKNPESLFLLEELRERRFDKYARIIQKAFQRFNAARYYCRLRDYACDIVRDKKQRRRHSINRNFRGDYIGLSESPDIQACVPRREKVLYAELVVKYDRRSKPSTRALILTSKHVVLVGAERVRKGPAKGQIKNIVKKKVPLDGVEKLSLSKLQDDFVILHIKDEYAIVMELVFKTEFLSLFHKQCPSLRIEFSNSVTYMLKKGRWNDGGTRSLTFVEDGTSSVAKITSSGKRIIVKIAAGLPSNTKPGKIVGLHASQRVSNGHSRRSSQPAPTRSAPKLDSLIQGMQRRISSRKEQHAVPYTVLKNSVPRKTSGSVNMSFMQPPDAGVSGKTRQSIKTSKCAPQPAPKPKLKPRQQTLPRCKCLYGYDAQDTDEIGFREGDVIEIENEDPSGWWYGVHTTTRKKGLFPGNYVERM